MELWRGGILEEPGWVPTESPPRHKPLVEFLASPSAEYELWTWLFPTIALIFFELLNYTRLGHASAFLSPSTWLGQEGWEFVGWPRWKPTAHQSHS
jgi:hypothetical protein